jgi:hypothetical protein
MSTLSGEPNIITDGLVLYLDAANPKSYPGTGTVWSDLSGNGNNGTLVNGPTFDSGNNGRIVFDGVNDSVVIPLSQSLQFLGTSSYTIEVWANQLVSQSGFPVLVGTEDGIAVGRDGINFSIWKSGLTTINFIHDRFTSNTQRQSSYINIPDTSVIGNVFQFTGTYDGINMNTYYNGFINRPSTESTGSVTNTITPFTLARRGNSASYFNGRIYSVKVYNRALSQQEILQNYNATKSRFGL